MLGLFIGTNVELKDKQSNIEFNSYGAFCARSSCSLMTLARHPFDLIKVHQLHITCNLHLYVNFWFSGSRVKGMAQNERTDMHCRFQGVMRSARGTAVIQKKMPM